MSACPSSQCPGAAANLRFAGGGQLRNGDPHDAGRCGAVASPCAARTDTSLRPVGHSHAAARGTARGRPAPRRLLLPAAAGVTSAITARGGGEGGAPPKGPPRGPSRAPFQRETHETAPARGVQCRGASRLPTGGWRPGPREHRLQRPGLESSADRVPPQSREINVLSVHGRQSGLTCAHASWLAGSLAGSLARVGVAAPRTKRAARAAHDLTALDLPSSVAGSPHWAEKLGSLTWTRPSGTQAARAQPSP
eukprot:scaffold853_cov386-Prasinococcus_capsulatus_cf.AAC.1